MSAILERKDVTLTITAFCFGLMVVPYFLKLPVLSTYGTKLNSVVSVLAACSILLALYAQMRRSLTMVRNKTKGWPWEVYLMAAMYVTAIIGFTLGQSSTPYLWIQYALVQSCDSAIPVLITFSLLSAAARSFRMRSIQSSLLVIVGIIVLLGQAPLTSVYIGAIEPIKDYFSLTFLTAGTRVFTICLTVGAIVLGVRTLVGKEEATLGIISKETEE